MQGLEEENYGNHVNGGREPSYVVEHDVATVQLDKDRQNSSIDALMDLLKDDADMCTHHYDMHQDDMSAAVRIDDTRTFGEPDHVHSTEDSYICKGSPMSLPVDESEIVATEVKGDPVNIELLLRQEEVQEDGDEDSYDFDDDPSSHFWWRSEILITFSRSYRGQVAYVVIDQGCTNDNMLLKESIVYVHCKEHHQPMFVVSTYIREEKEQQCSYTRPPRNLRRRWRYAWHAHKEATEVSFVIVEDANTSCRWETTTYEVVPTTTFQPQTQLQSEWVLVDCDEQDIALFYQHEVEMSQSVNVDTVEQPCNVQ